MWQMLALAGLQAGASFLSSKGAADSTAKNNRLQMMENERVRAANEVLAREMMQIPEVTTANVDEFMAAGKKAGYNPVTWLNSGALSLFKTTTGHNTAAAMSMMMGQPATLQRVPSALEGLGGALSAGVNTFGSLYQTQMKLDALSGASGVSGGANYRAPSPGTGGLYSVNDVIGGMGFAPRSYTTAGGAASRVAGLSGNLDVPFSGAPYPQNWKLGKVEVTNPERRWSIDPNLSDVGGAVSQRYGEGGEWFFFPDRLLHDTVANITGRTIRDWGKAAGMNVGDYKSVGEWFNQTTMGQWIDRRSNGAVQPYLPFPGAGPGVTYGW